MLLSWWGYYKGCVSRRPRSLELDGSLAHGWPNVSGCGVWMRLRRGEPATRGRGQKAGPAGLVSASGLPVVWCRLLCGRGNVSRSGASRYARIASRDNPAIQPQTDVPSVVGRRPRAFSPNEGDHTCRPHTALTAANVADGYQGWAARESWMTRLTPPRL
jgi:hypothetical protein